MSPIYNDGLSSTIQKENGHSDPPNGHDTNHSNGYTNGSATNGRTATPLGVEPMAIIGMACQFPQEAENPEKFWELLAEGRSAMTEFPKEKLKINSHYHPDPSHGSSVSLTLCWL